MADYKVSGDTRQDTARAASAKPSGCCCCCDKSSIYPLTSPPHSFYGKAQLRHIVLTTTPTYLEQTPFTREIRLHWLAKTGNSPFTELSNSKKEMLKLKFFSDDTDLTFSACTKFLDAHRKAASDKKNGSPKAAKEHKAIIKRTGDMCAVPKKGKNKKAIAVDVNVDKCMCFALESPTGKLRVMRVIDSTSESASFSAAVRAALRPHPENTFFYIFCGLGVLLERQ